MKKIILYAKDQDRTGIINTISNAITRFDGNIETSKMIKLETEFHMLILITIPNNNIKKLKKSLSHIKSLNIIINPVSNSIENIADSLFLFTLKGADNEGIVHTFTNYFSSQKINIEEMETDILNAPITGQPLFSLKATLSINDKLKNINHIKNDLIELSNKNSVAIKLKKI